MENKTNESDKSSEKIETPGASASPENIYLDGVAQLAAEQGARQTAADLPVGQRIRQLREEKNLSLSDLAQRCGMDEETLADIEKADSSPPLGTLVKIGKALDMKLGTLIAQGEDRPYTVVRVDERQQMSRFASQKGTRYGYSYQALAPRKSNRSMEPFIVTLEPVTEEVEPSAHEGEEFIFVLKGRLEILFAGSTEILEEGDSIYYDSIHPHLVKPLGNEPAQILAVLYSQ